MFVLDALFVFVMHPSVVQKKFLCAKSYAQKFYFTYATFNYSDKTFTPYVVLRTRSLRKS